MKITFFLKALLLSVIIYSCSDATPDVNAGNGYKFIFNNRGGRTSLVDSNNIVIISEHVLAHRFDAKFIVLTQKPTDIFLKCVQSNKSHNECKEEFEKSNFKQYWIVNKQSGVKYGPFLKIDYFNKMKVLGVPDSLKIDE